MIVQVVSPEAKLFEGECVQVSLPGSEGRFGVLHGHMNMVAALEAGDIEIILEGQDTPLVFKSSDGFVDITPERCTILVEKAEKL